MKKLVIAAVAATMVLTGCNTIKGLGKDVSKAGDAVVDGAKKVEQKIQ
ncbi:MAG: entericidin A/B family lipoprotein [Moraxella sp.]|nr:entericidin A/B family lipoprotein [Moraxella sp.]